MEVFKVASLYKLNSSHVAELDIVIVRGGGDCVSRKQEDYLIINNLETIYTVGSFDKVKTVSEYSSTVDPHQKLNADGSLPP